MTLNEFFTNLETKPSWSAGVAFNRTNALPLDKTSVFKTIDAAENYAATDAAAYPGQVIAVVTENTSSVYFINGQMTLQEIGEKIEIDNTSIIIQDNGTLSIAGFSQAENNAIPHITINDDGTKSITWEVPNNDDILNLQSNVNTLQSDVSNLKNKDSEIESTVSNLQSEVNGIQLELDNVFTKEGTQTAIANAISSAGHLKREVVEILPTGGETDPIDKDTIYMIKNPDITSGDAYVEYMLIEGTLVPIGSTEVDLNPYAKIVDVNETINEINSAISTKANVSDMNVLSDNVNSNTSEIETIKTTLNDKSDKSTVTNLSNEVNSLKTIGAEKNIIQSVDNNQFAIDSDRNLTLLDIAISKVTNLQSTLDSKVDKVSGSRLITQAEADKLEALVIDEETGGVEISGTVSAGNVQELYDKVIDIVTGNGQGTFDDELRDKLGIETGAQVNKIETILFNGTEVTVTNKQAIINYEISTASNETLGGVKSSTDENKISVEDDGTMKINTINVNNLVQTSSDILVLDAGTALD